MIQFGLKVIPKDKILHGQAEEGYEPYWERSFKGKCPTCGEKFEFTYKQHFDTPGFRFPSLHRSVKLPCGHKKGDYDAEHIDIYFRDEKGNPVAV